MHCTAAGHAALCSNPAQVTNTLAKLVIVVDDASVKEEEMRAVSGGAAS